MAVLDWSQCPAVESAPGRLSGAWVFKDTRMPVSAVFENLEAGATIDEIMEWFRLTRAGLTPSTWPSTSHSNSMRRAAKCCFTVGAETSPCSSLRNAATWNGCTSSSWAIPSLRTRPRTAASRSGTPYAYGRC